MDRRKLGGIGILILLTGIFSTFYFPSYYSNPDFWKDISYTDSLKGYENSHNGSYTQAVKDYDKLKKGSIKETQLYTFDRALNESRENCNAVKNQDSYNGNRTEYIGEVCGNLTVKAYEKVYHQSISNLYYYGSLELLDRQENAIQESNLLQPDKNMVKRMTAAQMLSILAGISVEIPQKLNSCYDRKSPQVCFREFDENISQENWIEKTRQLLADKKNGSISYKLIQTDLEAQKEKENPYFRKLAYHHARHVDSCFEQEKEVKPRYLDSPGEKVAKAIKNCEVRSQKSDPFQDE